MHYKTSRRTFVKGLTAAGIVGGLGLWRTPVWALTSPGQPNVLAGSQIHWHGIILPANMDGVPGLSFAGIAPDGMYEYTFKLNQNGTYWYHSHSGLQEQVGVYGPLIIDAIEPEPFAYDRDYVVMLSDWTEEAVRLLQLSQTYRR